MYKEIITRKVGSLLKERQNKDFIIQQREGKFFVISRHTNNIVTSVNNLKEAKELLNNRHKKADYDLGINVNKNKEIVVHLRMQKGLDKQQLIDFAKSKFKISKEDAEYLYNEAYPDGVDLQEDKFLCKLDEHLNTDKNIVPKNFINEVFNSLLENKEMSRIDTIEPILVENVKLCVALLLSRRNLI